MNVALIGYGYWGQILEKYLIRNEKYNLIKIYDPNYCGNNKMITKDINSILEDKNIESVVIATPVSTHYELSKLFLEKEKNIFCEKPLELDVDKIIELKKIADKNFLKIETNYIYTVSNSIIKLKEILKKLGKILFVKGNISQYGKIYSDADVYSVIGCHLISVIYFLFDADSELIIDRVTENLKDIYGQTSYGIIEGKIKNIKLNLEVSLNNIEKKREVIIYGENGIARFDMLKETTLKVKLFNTEKIEEYSYDESNNIQGALNKFYNVVKNNENSNINLSYKITKTLGEINGKI